MPNIHCFETMLLIWDMRLSYDKYHLLVYAWRHIPEDCIMFLCSYIIKTDDFVKCKFVLKHFLVYELACICVCVRARMCALTLMWWEQLVIVAPPPKVPRDSSRRSHTHNGTVSQHADPFKEDLFGSTPFNPASPSTLSVPSATSR
jgi:hypothetical protein